MQPKCQEVGKCSSACKSTVFNHQLQPIESMGGLTLKEKGCSDNIAILV